MEAIPITKKEFEDKLISYQEDEEISNVSVDKSSKKRVLKRTICETYLLTDIDIEDVNC